VDQLSEGLRQQVSRDLSVVDVELLEEGLVEELPFLVPGLAVHLLGIIQ
jgi:hypothetical protein